MFILTKLINFTGMYQKEFKKNEKCVFFGKMFRFRNDTMMPASSQKMMANLGNTMVESSITKIMRRGECIMPLQ
jgi:hypothetical protein